MASWCMRTQRKMKMFPDGQLVHEDPEEGEDVTLMVSWCTRTQKKMKRLPDGQLVHEDAEEDEDVT